MPFRAFLLVFLAALPLRAATLPPDFTETLLARGIVRPTAMALAPDGRIFVCEQTGALRVIKDGKLLPQPFVTVPVFTEGERGLLGVTVDPDFPRTPHVYLYYTAVKPFVHNRVSRFTAAGDRAAAGSEKAVLDLPQLAKPIHNGGAMHFGPDGLLYVAVGENAVPEHAQNLRNPLGKILRLGKDGSIPSDNPFPGSAIWALGLRNPFSFAFQPGTGRMFINDVGRKEWEEINEGEAGANYGWPVNEGPTDDPAYTAPLYAYRHGPTAATGCAISGGAFYDPAEEQFPSEQFPPEYLGTYFFSDFCSGWIRRLDPATRTAHAFATGIGGPIGLQVGDDGSLYYLAYVEGTVSRIDYTGSPAPRITAQPESLKVTLGAPATFAVGASGAPPLRYQWRRNGVDVTGAEGPSYTLQAEEGATFDVVVANDHGSVTSDPATLTVTTDKPPMPRITAPAAGLLYQGGQTIAYAGDALDPEGGPVTLTWRIDFHHAEHFHPFVPEASGAGGTFTVPTIGETASDVWFRIHLTAKDPAGLAGTTFVDVLPRKVRLTFLTDPPGRQVLLDGTPRTTPFTEEAVAGLVRTIGAAEPVTWSDGGATVHEIATPAVDTTYTATFQAPRHGLLATYFDDLDLSRPVLTRVDPNVDFHWGQGSPAPGVGRDTFSVRWTGKVQAKVTGPHTFLVRADNGARLWIDGRLLQSREKIQLEAGRMYGLRLEYYENQGAAMVQLLWSAPGLRRQVVPEDRLTP